MRSPKLVLALLCAAAFASPASAATARIVKVLPQYLDREGRVGLSPSLYDRDAYQAVLRSEPGKQGGLRFQVQWKSSSRTPLTLRVELRGVRQGKATTAMIETSAQHRGLFSKWSTADLAGDDFKLFGDLRAWRCTLWEGDKQLSEQASFLW
jgi:hypothetical protein